MTTTDEDVHDALESLLRNIIHGIEDRGVVEARLDSEVDLDRLYCLGSREEVGHVERGKKVRGHVVVPQGVLEFEYRTGSLV